MYKVQTAVFIYKNRQNVIIIYYLLGNKKSLIRNNNFSNGSKKSNQNIITAKSHDYEPEAPMMSGLMNELVKHISQVLDSFGTAVVFSN